jgi:hypothetical protein
VRAGNAGAAFKGRHETDLAYRGKNHDSGSVLNKKRDPVIRIALHEIFHCAHRLVHDLLGKVGLGAGIGLAGTAARAATGYHKAQGQNT